MIKQNGCWRDKFLQSPAASEPSALFGEERGLIIDVSQIRNTDVCGLVPAVHRVDGFGKLSTGGLVNATGVHPEVAIPSQRSNTATRGQLGVSELLLSLASIIVHVLESDFFLIPSMR